MSKLSVETGLSNFLTDNEGIELVNEWRSIRSDVYKQFIYSREYMGFEYLVFELISEYASTVRSDGIANLFHYTDERLLWTLYNTVDFPKLRNLAKRLLLHELPNCHGILRTSSFHLKDHLAHQNRLASIAVAIKRTLQTTNFVKTYSWKTIGLHLTTDDRKTCRAIPMFIDQNGVPKQVVLGQDQRFLLIAVLSDNLDRDDERDAIIMDVAARELHNQGAKGVDVITWDDDRIDSPQYPLF